MKGSAELRTQEELTVQSQRARSELVDRPQPPRDSGEVYRLHADRVARWVARLGGPAVDVEDTVQEVFVKVHRLLAQFRGDAELTTWLYRITENVTRARRRKERVR